MKEVDENVNSGDVEGLVNELRIVRFELKNHREELQQVRRELEESRQSCARLDDSTSVGFLKANAELVITGANLAAAGLLNMKKEALLQLSFRQFVKPDRLADLELCCAAAAETGSSVSCELEMVRDNGAPFHAHVEILPVSESSASYRLALTDITPWKITEERLRRSEDLYRRILETAHEGICLVDNEGRISSVNARMAYLLGYSAKELVGRPLLDLVAQHEHRRALGMVQSLRRRRLDRVVIEYRTSSGKTLCLITSAARIDREGDIGGYLVALADVTDQRDFEKELRKTRKVLTGAVAEHAGQLSTARDVADVERQGREAAQRELKTVEQSFRNVINSSADGIVIADRNGIIRFVNPAGISLLGRTENELLGTVMGFPVAGEESAELDVIGSAGKTATVEMRVVETEWEGEPSYLAMLHDITERKRAQEELRRLNRALRTIREVNMILGRAADEEGLLDRICQTIVRMGGFRMAWVGTVAGEDSAVELLSKAGYEDGYVQAAGRTPPPVFSVLSTNKPFITRYTGDSSIGEPWFDEAVKRGYGASISYPLRIDERTFAVLNIYSADPDAFDRDEIELLAELAGDVSFGLTALRDRKRRNRAESELRMLSRRLVEAQEEERRAVARELHDEVGQSLTVLKLLLSKAMNGAREPVRSDLRDVDKVIDEIVQQVRNLSLNLRPGMLDDLGLRPTLLWYFERFTNQTGIMVNFQHNNIPRDIPIDVAIAAYRIVQEALTNVTRHAGVGEVRVHTKVMKNVLRVEIEDRGKGFLISAPTRSSGLSGMRERAELLGGKVTVNSAPGKGTTVTAELPLRRSRA